MAHRNLNDPITPAHPTVGRGFTNKIGTGFQLSWFNGTTTSGTESDPPTTVTFLKRLDAAALFTQKQIRGFDQPGCRARAAQLGEAIASDQFITPAFTCSGLLSGMPLRWNMRAVRPFHITPGFHH